MIEHKLRELSEAAIWRAKKPSNWMKRWRLGLEFDLEFLRLSQMRIAIPNGKVSDCANCEEICCTGPKAVIHLRLKDMASLVDQGLERHIAKPVPQHQQTVGSKTQLEKAFDESLFAQIFPTLTRDKHGTCQLLTDDLKCSVYPRWPLSCARYPFAIDSVNRVIFYANGCRSSQIVPPSQAPSRFSYLAQAAVESYNERIRDLYLLAFARKELENLGLMAYLDVQTLKRQWRWLIR